MELDQWARINNLEQGVGTNGLDERVGAMGWDQEEVGEVGTFPLGTPALILRSSNWLAQTYNRKRKESGAGEVSSVARQRSDKELLESTSWHTSGIFL